MSTKSLKTGPKGGAKKLKLKKDTLTDLDAKETARRVKGGANNTLSPLVSCRCASLPLRTCSNCNVNFPG